MTTDLFRLVGSHTEIEGKGNMLFLGVTRDRRVPNHIDEVCVEANLHTLMCPICDLKHAYFHS